jgi:23S rRNA (adenine2030-N6)-methyltransferase
MKKRAEVVRYRNALAASGVPNIIDAELSVRDSGGEKLDGCGMTIINPPFTLEAELRVMLAALAPVLEMEPRTARWGVKRLAGEVQSSDN